MEITKNVITDLLPLYLSDDCSDDTKALVGEYLRKDPLFAEEVMRISKNPLPSDIPHPLMQGEEISTLHKTRRLIKQRTTFLAFAIFCTVAPFSVLYTHGRYYWLFIEAPLSASIYFLIGAACWIGYFATKRKTKDL